MSININIPEDLYAKAAALAEVNKVSVDEIFAAAFSQQLANLERLQARAKRGHREAFLAVLDKVPDVDPPDYDRL